MNTIVCTELDGYRDNSQDITADKVRKIIRTVDRGLSSGVGKRKPGRMCVEAAVCYGMGYEHGDRPICVEDSIRDFKIGLNDANGWPSKAARAEGLRKVAIAQLGTAGKITEYEFNIALGIRIVQKILAHGLNSLAAIYPFTEIRNRLKRAAKMTAKVDRQNVLEVLSEAKTATERAFENYGISSDPKVKLIRNLSNCLNIFTCRLIEIHKAKSFEKHAGSGAAALWHHNGIYTHTSKKEQHAMLLMIADCLLKALKDVHAPGCKFLYLLRKTK